MLLLPTPNTVHFVPVENRLRKYWLEATITKVLHQTLRPFSKLRVEAAAKHRGVQVYSLEFHLANLPTLEDVHPS